MDDLVRAALAKWPDVPDCYGWLALDARGQWRLGAERQTITNAAMNAFIGRNYGCDARGQWLFQNGPQKVFVALDYTPWVWRTLPAASGLALQDQTGAQVAGPDAIWLDDAGRLLFLCADKIGVLHDHDAETVIDLLRGENGTTLSGDALGEALAAHIEGHGGALQLHWPAGRQALALQTIRQADVPARFGFIAQPRAG